MIESRQSYSKESRVQFFGPAWTVSGSKNEKNEKIHQKQTFTKCPIRHHVMGLVGLVG